MNSATAPATCGQAILVPLSTEEAVRLLYDADRILLPGANTVTHDPKLLNDERLSFTVDAPTEMALLALAGEVVQASVFSFPAATTITTPSFTALLTAVLIEFDFGPPKLIEPIDRFGEFRDLSIIQSMPCKI